MGDSSPSSRSRHDYEGDELDYAWQYFDERPAADSEEADGAPEIVYATDPEDDGEESVENVPVPDSKQRPDVNGQTTLDDWGWSP